MKKHYWIKMALYFLLDFAAAAAIVYGYYWTTYKQVREPVTDQLVILPPETTTAAMESMPETSLQPETKSPLETSLQSETESQPETGLQSETESQLETSLQPETESQLETEPLLESPAQQDTEAVSESAVQTETADPPETEETDPVLEQLTWTEKYRSHFTAEPVQTDNAYSDEHISVAISSHTQGTGDDQITYYVADIYVADITYFRTGIYEDDGTFQWTTTPIEYAMENPMDVLITNGDYCGYNQQGLIIRNGRVYRDETSDVELCVLRYDGTMETYAPNTYTLEMAVEQGAWQTWSFGPSLLDENGKALNQFSVNSYISKAHPRTAIGYYEPGHYCMVVVDGRETGYSRGMTMAELAQTFEALGCQTAYNLDGGGSSCMLFAGTDVNHTQERYVSDFIVVTNQLPE